MTKKLPTRVVVAEDDLYARVGIATLIRAQSDLAVVAEVGDGVQAVAAYRQHAPDVLVTDLRMPKLDGVETIRTIRGFAPDARILVLTHYDGEDLVSRALQAGASGYVTKEARGEVLMDAIRTVALGQRFLPPEIVSRVVGGMSQSEITARERQVIALVAEGISNREIGQKLKLSERTVGVYVSSVLGKFGAKSRTEAVSIAKKRGILNE